MSPAVHAVTPLDLARWTGLVLGLCSLGLIGFVYRLFRRRQPATLTEKLLVLGGLALLPAATLGVGNVVAMQTMEGIGFCGSCHVMTPFVRDLADPASTTLAAAHSLNHRVDPGEACYTCHHDYELFGTAVDKYHGLHHVWAYYVAKPKGPIHMYQPFKNATCLHCHGGAKSFESHPAHLAVMDQIHDESLSCLTCHGPMHPKDAGARP